MLEVHHLRRSQSERIVWICEELNISYKLHTHERNPETALAPPIFKELHKPGSAPVIVDTISDGRRVVIGESGACVEYIINVHGGGRFQVKPDAPNYAEYLSWWHFSNASFQASNMRMMLLDLAFGEQEAQGTISNVMKTRHQVYLDMLDERLGQAPYLAGDELTAADIMTVYALTTNRGFRPIDLTGRNNILAYLQRIAQRDGYKRAREKGDPQDAPLISAKVERFPYGSIQSKQSKA